MRGCTNSFHGVTFFLVDFPQARQHVLKAPNILCERNYILLLNNMALGAALGAYAGQRQRPTVYISEYRHSLIWHCCGAGSCSRRSGRNTRRRLVCGSFAYRRLTTGHLAAEGQVVIACDSVTCP